MIGDSRCCALRHQLARHGINFYTYRGAGLATIGVRAAVPIERHSPRVCLILAGINDATLFDRRHRIITPLFEDAFTLSNHIIRLILRTRNSLLDRFPGLPQPRLTSKVHGWKKGRRINQYYLLHDGLHLGLIVRNTWLREILKCDELYNRRR